VLETATVHALQAITSKHTDLTARSRRSVACTAASHACKLQQCYTAALTRVTKWRVCFEAAIPRQRCSSLQHGILTATNNAKLHTMYIDIQDESGLKCVITGYDPHGFDFGEVNARGSVIAFPTSYVLWSPT
jgi:hypothetical protein